MNAVEISSLHCAYKPYLVFNFIGCFDARARKSWQKTMQKHKPVVNITWLIIDNVFVVGAAKTRGLLTSFPVKATKSINEIVD
jgi:hypothetical protein